MYVMCCFVSTCFCPCVYCHCEALWDPISGEKVCVCASARVCVFVCFVYYISIIVSYMTLFVRHTFVFLFQRYVNELTAYKPQACWRAHDHLLYLYFALKAVLFKPKGSDSGCQPWWCWPSGQVNGVRIKCLLVWTSSLPQPIHFFPDWKVLAKARERKKIWAYIIYTKPAFNTVHVDGKKKKEKNKLPHARS